MLNHFGELPDDGDFHEGEEVVDVFVISGSDPSVLFEPSDESFHDVAFAVGSLIEWLFSLVASGGNHRLDIPLQ